MRLALASLGAIPRRENSTLWSPSSLDAPFECAIWDAFFASPIFHALRFPFSGNPDGNATVSDLLVPRRPSAVVGAVVAIIIDAVKRVFRGWFRPHIGVEVLERFQPASANRYAPSPVSIEVFVIRIRASLFHAPPRRKFKRDSAISRASVLVVDLCRRLSLQTAARFTASLFQDAQRDRALCAAYASAQLAPVFSCRLGWVVVDNHPPMKHRAVVRVWYRHKPYCIDFRE